jgi:hypothetical protein
LKEKFPYLIIGYSRFEGLARLLSTLDPLRISKIYLALDGTDSVQILQRQEQIITLVRSYALENSLGLETWVRAKNLGVAVSIITAVDWLFENEEVGVVLEDDLIVGKDFFDYLPIGLQHILDLPQALLVSGNQFVVPIEPNSVNVWTNYPLIWGWATYREKWVIMRQGILEAKSRRKDFRLSQVANFWLTGSLRVQNGYVDTWDIPLAQFMHANHKLCLLPPVNLISNRGDDIYASHTKNGDFPLNFPVADFSSKSNHLFPIDFSNVPSINYTLEKNLFKIKQKHFFLPIISLVSDWILFGKLRKAPLSKRLQDFRLLTP